MYRIISGIFAIALGMIFIIKRDWAQYLAELSKEQHKLCDKSYTFISWAAPIFAIIVGILVLLAGD